MGTESKYGYNTASIYFTETKGVYVTKTITQSYPMTNYVTKTGYETKGYYVTQTKVQNQYVTQTVKKPYYNTSALRASLARGGHHAQWWLPRPDCSSAIGYSWPLGAQGPPSYPGS